ncbi:MAG TPA: FKBP-type peptidyl-prolyl cis-trans isomerase N-terminal domain-containing protein [Chlamydiales bacterium]|jgi:peptidylprolyl isomerase|nr:FKBP-type peptidyl-prolyl cis-trans isomerase N-terminal domain-containing protein [Chlamydiales bacterium]
MIHIFCAALLLAAPSNLEKISEALGHLIGKHIENLDLPLDLNALAKGIEEAREGKESPLNEEACLEAIEALQKEKNSELAKKNIEEAENFLALNAKKSGVQTLVDGKLQARIVKKGKGQKVQPYNSPIVRISGQYIDGKVFSTAHEEELLSLEESIPAFRLGVEGMKEGEVRTLYVHPEYGYGDEGHLNPGALLIFEVEVVRADAATDEEIALDSPMHFSLQ